MPYGRYPERVKPFRKWANEKIDRGSITDSATGGAARSGRRPSGRSRYRSTTRKRKKAMKEE